MTEIFPNPEVRGSPTYWWPESRAWCICTDWDLTSTLVGGPHELVELLASDSDLECIIVKPTMRVDSDADRANS